MASLLPHHASAFGLRSSGTLLCRPALQSSVRLFAAKAQSGLNAQMPVQVPESGFRGSIWRPQVAEFPGARAKLEANAKANASAPHHRALQKIAELMAPVTGEEGVVQKMRERRVRLRGRKELSQQQDVYEASVEFLMHPDTWTYGNMAAYQMKVLDLMGAYGWRRRLSADDPAIAHLEKELRVLQSMTPVEMASNHKSVFSRESVALIAEKSGAKVQFVNQVIMEHDILRGDRRWYKILTQFDRPLPKTFEDRQFYAEFDRPYSETEKEVRQKMIDEQQAKSKQNGVKPKRFRNIWFRTPSCGGNRWSTRPPKWYPARFKMRQERVARLGGPSMGGNARRSGPWGNFAKLGVGARPGYR